MSLVRLLSIAGTGLLLALEGAIASPSRPIDVRPEPPPRQDLPLEGKAAGYYAFCLSQQALMERDLERASGHLEEALRVDPGSGELSMELARVYLALQRANDALEQARRAAKLDPGDAEPRRFIVEIFQIELSRNDDPSERLLEEAVEAHQDLLRLEPGDADALLGLARIHYAMGSFGQAIAVLQPHVRSHPGSLDAAHLLARALARSGSPSKARQVLEEAVEARPDHVELRATLAEIREQAGDLAGAEALLRALTAEIPERRDFRFSLIRVLERRGDRGGASRSAEELIRDLGSPPPASREEADLMAAHMLRLDVVAGEDLRRAEEIAIEAQSRFPGERRFALKRAEILLLLGKDAAAGEILGTKGSGPGREPLSKEDVSLVFLRAGARSERESNLRRAEELLRRSVEADPANHTAMNYLGYMLAERNEKLEEALGLVQRALELDPANGAYLDSLGWTYYRLGRLEEAQEPLERAAESIPEEAVVRDHLGDLYWARGKAADAVRAWQAALDLGISDPSRVEQKIRQAGRPAAGP